MNKPIPPCGAKMDCQKRTTGCHSNYIDYIFFQAANEARSEAIRKEKELQQAPIERCNKLTEKVKKRHRRK